MIKIRECKKLMKVCKECKQLLLMNNYYNKKSCFDRKENICKKCKYKKSFKYTLICEQCKETFLSRTKNKRFCSNECCAKSKENQVEFKCDYCKKICKHKESEYNKNKHHFCSKECYDKWQKENSLRGKENPRYSQQKVKCDYCNKDFEIIYAKLGQYHHFCSRTCQGKWNSQNRKGKNNPMFGIHRFGKDSPNWNCNLTQKEREIQRNTVENNQWRKKVYERDCYTCQITGDNKGGNLVAHHLYSYTDYPKLRYDIDNGITITKEVHLLFHHIYGYKHNTKEQFEDFRKRYNSGEFKEVV